MQEEVEPTAGAVSPENPSALPRSPAAPQEDLVAKNEDDSSSPENDAPNKKNQERVEISTEGWEQLMGKDLLLKVRLFKCERDRYNDDY